MSVAGKFSTMSIADLIQWGRTAQRTGLLMVGDDAGKKIQIVFRDGRIIFSSTNEKRERWQAYLSYHGYCSKEDVEAAFKAAETDGVSLASTLVREGKITHDQAVETLTEKTIEDLCDVFLWKDGTFQFDPGTPNTTDSVIIDLDPVNVVWEGTLRTEVWTRLTAYIHPTSFYEHNARQVDGNGWWEDLPMAKHVWPHIDERRNVGDLIDRLPFSRYKIYRALSELLARQMIRQCDVTEIFDRKKRIQRHLGEAQSAMQAGRWTEAMEILRGLATANPDRLDILEELSKATRGFEESVLQHNFAKEDVPVVTIGPDSLTRLNLHPSEAFVLSRIDGRMTVRDILKISPMSEFDGLRAFKRLLSAKVIDFPIRKAPTQSRVPRKPA
jgi:uncharacterized protein DUF4388